MLSELKTFAPKQAAHKSVIFTYFKVRETMKLYLYGLVFMVLAVKSEHVGE